MFADKEIDIIRSVQSLYPIFQSEIALFPEESPQIIDILEKICDSAKWGNWTDSSGKDDPPPDFYSDEYQLMMDVMRVDDHERKNKKGKLYNPTNAHNRDLLHELEEKGILAQFPNAQVFINGQTDLPTFEDHNYTFYRKSFQRVIQKHIESIPIYQKNHPNYKIIFFIFDESSAYFESKKKIDKKQTPTKGKVCSGRPHWFFTDDAFLNAFVGKGIDYLVWYTPYKRFEFANPPIPLPQICVFDLSKPLVHRYKFDEERMISSEI